MRLCLVAIGSRGDVTPVVSVGVTLAHRGHEVRIVTLADYAALVPASLIVVPVDADTSTALWPRSPALRRLALAQPGFMYALMRAQLHRAGPAIADAVWRGGHDADLIVAGTATRSTVARLVEAQGRGFATLLLAPLLPSGRSASGVLVPAHAPAIIGRAVSQGMWTLTAGLGAGPAAAMTRRLGRSEAQAPHETIVLATDPVISPPDPVVVVTTPGGRRPATIVNTGWIPASLDATPPTLSPANEGLADFLAERPDAVLMTFGSCPVVDPDADARLFRRAAGTRPVVLQTDALPAGRLDAHAWNAPGIDHRWLMPRVAAVVHHGGAGTTMTTLACGRPAVVVPHLGDQGYYARRIAELGVGVQAGPRWRLTVPRLAQALALALASDRAARAQTLGLQVTERSGAEPTAVALEAAARCAP